MSYKPEVFRYFYCFLLSAFKVGDQAKRQLTCQVRQCQGGGSHPPHGGRLTKASTRERTQMHPCLEAGLLFSYMMGGVRVLVRAYTPALVHHLCSTSSCGLTSLFFNFLICSSKSSLTGTLAVFKEKASLTLSF